MVNRRMELHNVDRGSLTGNCYSDEVILLYIHLFRGAIGPDFVFMGDNSPPYRFYAVEELLERGYQQNGLASRFLSFKSHRTCVGCFGEPPSGVIQSSGELQTTETDVH